MLSYPIVDRDRERLVRDLDMARQFDPRPVRPPQPIRRPWFRPAVIRGVAAARQV